MTTIRSKLAKALKLTPDAVCVHMTSWIFDGYLGELEARRFVASDEETAMLALFKHDHRALLFEGLECKLAMGLRDESGFRFISREEHDTALKPPQRPSTAELAEQSRAMDDAALERLRTMTAQPSGNALLAELLAQIHEEWTKDIQPAQGTSIAEAAKIAHNELVSAELSKITEIVRQHFTEKLMGVRLHERRECKACGMLGAAFFRCEACEGLLCDNCRNAGNNHGRALCAKCQRKAELLEEGKIDPEYTGDDPGSLEVCMADGDYLTHLTIPRGHGDDTRVPCCSECQRKDRELCEAVYGKPGGGE